MRYRIDIIRVTEGEEEIEVIFQMIKLMVFQTKVKNESESHSVVSNSLWPRGLYNTWNSPGQNTGVGSLSLLQRIFPTQGSNPGLPHCRWILYQLSHKGSLRILEWVAYPRIKPVSPALKVDSLPTEPQGKPRNTGVGSLSLLQQIFLTQESNWGLLHCRWILSKLKEIHKPSDPWYKILFQWYK